MAYFILAYLTIFEYASFFASPLAVPISLSQEGSLKYTKSLIIMDCILIKTCKRVEIFGSQFSVDCPLQVPNKLKQTFPLAYKLGLNLVVFPPVVIKFTFGGAFGY